MASEQIENYSTSKLSTENLTFRPAPYPQPSEGAGSAGDILQLAVCNAGPHSGSSRCCQLSEGFAFKIFLLHTQQPKTWIAWYTGLPSMLQQTLWQKRGRAETSDEVPGLLLLPAILDEVLGLLFLSVLFLSETDNSETSLSTTVDSPDLRTPTPEAKGSKKSLLLIWRSLTAREFGES